MNPDEVTSWMLDHENRLSSTESAVGTLAKAADKQEQFNNEVIEFMSEVRTWGKMALILYALGQAIFIAIFSAIFALKIS